MKDESTDPNRWAENLSPASIQLWREAITHLREMNREVWRGFWCFLAASGMILLITSALLCLDQSGSIALAMLAAGLGVAFLGAYVLKRNRVYYLQMLLKKSLLEKEFGFYEVRFSGSKTDLAFPWRVAPEVLAQMKEAPEKWINAQIMGTGTIARRLFLAYYLLMGLYIPAIVYALMWRQ